MKSLAERLGVTPAAVQKRLARMEGRVSIRRNGREKLVNVAEYLAADKLTRDGVRTAANALGQAGKRVGRPKKGDDGELIGLVLQEEQARRAKIEADRAQIKLDNELGRLIPVDVVKDAALKVAAALVRVADSLHLRAPEIAAEIAKNGEGGVRAILKDISREFRDRLASTLTALVATGDNEVSTVETENNCASSH